LRFSPTLAREAVMTWTPPVTVDPRRTEEDVLDELPRLLVRSIARRRWRKPALTLSSGLDSASLAGTIASDKGLRERFSIGDRPRAITLSYPGWECDETEEAGRLAQHFSIAHAVVDATGTGPVETAGELGEACDQPYGATGYEALLVLREARRLGHESLATGIGAEYSWETVAYLAADLLRQRRWGRLLRETNEYAGRNIGKLASVFWREAIRPWIGEGVRRSRHLGQRHASGLSERGAWESMMWRSKAVQMAGVQSGPQMEFLEQLGVHEGVEMIHPFLDREMVEFAFRTPPQLLGTLTNQKRLLACTMARRFPGALGEHPKTPSPDPFVARSLRSAFDRPVLRGHWRLPAIVPLDSKHRDLLRRASLGQPLETPSKVWNLVCHEFWLRRHFPDEGCGDETRSATAVA
jgi:asparagine synthetase B (glutamine-hydrolysing)